MTWRVARSLETLLSQVNQLAPHRLKSSDGSIGDAAHASRDSDHNPHYVLSGEPIVTARDITHDPGNGMDCNVLADTLLGSRDPRIKYIIWNRQIAYSGSWRWVRYNGPNPHTKHLHISVVATPACDDPRPWVVAGSNKPTPVGPSGPRNLSYVPDAPLMEGPDVAVVQRVLKAWYPFLNLKVDGVYGPKTADAVRHLQRRARISVDGIVGPTTRKVLGL